MRSPDGLRRLAESEHVCHRANSIDMIDMRWWFETAADVLHHHLRARTHMKAGDTTATSSFNLAWVEYPCSVPNTPGLNKADQDRKGAWQGKPSDLENTVVKHRKCHCDRARESGHPRLHRSIVGCMRCFSTGLSQP
jgi:hypothetical protein